MSGTPSSETTFREGDRCGGCGFWWWDDHGPSRGGKGWHSLVPISYADHRDEARLVCCPACEEDALVSGFPYDRDTPTEARETLIEDAPQILDACCGGRMWWWDKAHPLAVYLDKRESPRGSVGEITGRPEWNPSWECKPDVLGDFRAMPFEDGAFRLVVFDPPHIVRPEPVGINGLKYGALPAESEQDDLRRGFAECWRVLAPGGTLVFKWAGPLGRVEPHFPATPIVGTRTAPRGTKGLGTRWFVFYKPLPGDPATIEAAA